LHYFFSTYDPRHLKNDGIEEIALKDSHKVFSDKPSSLITLRSPNINKIIKEHKKYIK